MKSCRSPSRRSFCWSRPFLRINLWFIFSLHDFRQCGSSQHKLLRSSPVTKYTTSLSKQSAPLLARPEATSVTFDPAGSCFTALFSKYQPTLYAVGDPLPLATLAAEGLENRCTIKHGSFGKNFKTGQLRYSCGSDDCVIRSWDLPAPETLKDARDSVTASNWTSEEPDAPKLSDLYFAQTIRGDRVRPVTLNKEAHALKGHRSIVNVRSLPFKPSLALGRKLTLSPALLVCAAPPRLASEWVAARALSLSLCPYCGVPC